MTRAVIVSRREGRNVPGGKTTLTDGGTRVPLIANWPGTIRPGQVVDDLVDFSDFFPTFLDLAGVAIPAELKLDGSSFAPRLRGEGKSARNWVYAEASVLPKPGGVEPSGPDTGMKWVRNADWKLYSDGRLFEMRVDAQEKKPVLRDQDSNESRRIREQL
jgi:arylsulfatase A